ncbi:hypothetical protein BJV78DRAFT_1131762 [Lactifluus subvellereus]|nr:hypothetical protein BJV78DRAFT_1131762 [Lactifluus subvellereus]
MVHLPSRSASYSTDSHCTPAHSDSSQHVSEHHSNGHSSSSSSQRVASTPHSQYESLPSLHGSGGERAAPELAVGLEGSLAPLQSSSSSIGSGSSARGTGKSGGSSSGYLPSEEPLVTFRFEHREDGDGYHVVIGREGNLTRCEDEPIRTPGAVQGFGVLIAVQEDPEEDKLIVRQVSENSTELLGLTPRYLFSLPCFTDVLPDSQAGILWDTSSTSPTQKRILPARMTRFTSFCGWGMPGSAVIGEGDKDPQGRLSLSCWCAAHRPKMARNGSGIHDLVILEFELEHDLFNPLYPVLPTPQDAYPFSGLSSPSSNGSGSTGTSSNLVSTYTTSQGPVSVSSTTLGPSSPVRSWSSLATQTNTQPLPGLQGGDEWVPSAEDILESTTNHAKPLPALERIRKMCRAVPLSPGTEPGENTRRGNRRGRCGGAGMMDVFAVMAQISEQLGTALDVDTFLKVVLGLIKDLTQFHRVLVYQFDEGWNGQVVAELVDWNRTHDLYRGLHFQLSRVGYPCTGVYSFLYKMRLLYDREQVTARIVVRSKDDLDVPLNMTHCFLRAMSPIHLQYLANMGVRSSMSVSILSFGQLWGLVACHSYGPNGMRASFPIRQILRLMSDSISRNIERLSYAQRLHTRKLFNTVTGESQQSQSYIISNANDLLGLFDADFGMLIIGEGAKILGPNKHGQEVLVVAEYLRLKHFGTIQVSQAVTKDFPDLQLSTGLEIIAGLLYVPLSQGGTDFIALLRKGQQRTVRWAGRPYKEGGQLASLEPRASFKVWSETVVGRCRAWTDEQLETAGVLALVYGKFIEAWREREKGKLTNILLSNAGHEVRTPLNRIINCLELALNGKLDVETRQNLSQSHAASKSLLFTINDLLYDLTRLESGNKTTFNEPFDLQSIIIEATNMYKHEAQRKGLDFELDISGSPRMVVGGSSKIKTLVANLTANALKYTQRGSITVSCRVFDKPEGLRDAKQVAVELVVRDTGCGIPADKLESIFREFEQVESAQPKKCTAPGLGLGLAVVARSIQQLGGQLRVDSKVDQGSRFSFLTPFTLWDGRGRPRDGQHGQREASALVPSPSPSPSVLSSDVPVKCEREAPGAVVDRSVSSSPGQGVVPAVSVTSNSQTLPPQASKIDAELIVPGPRPQPLLRKKKKHVHAVNREGDTSPGNKLRILSVEDNDINRLILAKRLQLDGHTVVNTTNGKEGVEMIETDPAFDCVLMDVQMPILNGLEATQRIRELEATKLTKTDRLTHSLNGGRIPIFAVSASLLERQRKELEQVGIDGWILKPIDFRRLHAILCGVTDPVQRSHDEYRVGCSWERGGWLLRSWLPASVSASAPSADGAGLLSGTAAEDGDTPDTNTLHET